MAWPSTSWDSPFAQVLPHHSPLPVLPGHMQPGMDEVGAGRAQVSMVPGGSAGGPTLPLIQDGAAGGSGGAKAGTWRQQDAPLFQRLTAHDVANPHSPPCKPLVQRCLVAVAVAPQPSHAGMPVRRGANGPDSEAGGESLARA